VSSPTAWTGKKAIEASFQGFAAPCPDRTGRYHRLTWSGIKGPDIKRPGIKRPGIKVYERENEGRGPSRRLHETVQNTFLAGAVERDGQLVALDTGDIAIAEFEVKHPVADLEW